MSQRKIITSRNFLCLWSKMIWKASLVRHKFFSFKNRPNISQYVEYSRTLIWVFEDFKFAYKTTKFYAKWLKAILDLAFYNYPKEVFDVSAVEDFSSDHLTVSFSMLTKLKRLKKSDSLQSQEGWFISCYLAWSPHWGICLGTLCLWTMTLTPVLPAGMTCFYHVWVNLFQKW